MGPAAEHGVSVEKVSKVTPETRSGKQAMFLSTCDLVCRSYPNINRIFFFKTAPETAATPFASLLKEGLARALVSFYPLAGRLVVNQEGRLQVENGDEDAAGGGAEFVEAFCDLPYSELAVDSYQYRNLFWSLVRRTHLVRSDHVDEPILSIQVTRFRDGAGLSVGVAMSHVLADAQSFYDFVKSWGEVCRGLAMSAPPLHMRAALGVRALFPSELLASSAPSKDSNASTRETCCEPKSALEQVLPVTNFSKEATQNEAIVVDALAKQLDDQVGIVGKNAACTVGQTGEVVTRTQAAIIEKQSEEEEHSKPRADLAQKVFSFSLETLQHLKGRANAGPRSFTTFEAFCAHWWQCFIRAKRLPGNQPVFLLIPINCRRRFLNLPKSFFGNALDGGLVKMTAGELCEGELQGIADKIHRAIKAVTEESFKEYVREAESQRNAVPHFDRRGLFHISDSPQFPVYDVDFGFGTPEAVRAEGFRFGAEVQILTGRLGRGGYDLFCAHDPDTMHRLELDPTFLHPK